MHEHRCTTSFIHSAISVIIFGFNISYLQLSAEWKTGKNRRSNLQKWLRGTLSQQLLYFFGIWPFLLDPIQLVHTRQWVQRVGLKTVSWRGQVLSGTKMLCGRTNGKKLCQFLCWSDKGWVQDSKPWCEYHTSDNRLPLTETSSFLQSLPFLGAEQLLWSLQEGNWCTWSVFPIKRAHKPMKRKQKFVWPHPKANTNCLPFCILCAIKEDDSAKYFCKQCQNQIQHWNLFTYYRI